MAALQVGPVAGNLVGMRRAARVVATPLDCRSWLRERALVNLFMALDASTSEEEDDSDNTANDPTATVARRSGEDDIACNEKSENNTANTSAERCQEQDCSPCGDQDGEIPRWAPSEPIPDRQLVPTRPPSPNIIKYFHIGVARLRVETSMCCGAYSQSATIPYHTI